MKPPLLFAAACAFSFAAVIDARADEPYPAKPVRIIVPYPAGGVADLLPRTVGQKLSDKWGQPVIVENKPGASGNIGMAEGARAAADGYTIVLAPTGNLTVNQFLFNNLPFDAARDFTPITVLATSPNVLVVHPSVPAKTFRELIDYAKANPGKLNFASPGEGSGAHLAGELLNIEAGIKTTHIPYKGMAPAVTDLLGGQVQVYFGTTASSIEYVRSGKLRALAVTTATRAAALPDVPALAEFLPTYEASIFVGIVAPRGTPADIIGTLNQNINLALNDPKMKQRIAELADTPLALSVADFAKLIADDTEKWAKVIRASNIKPQ